MFFTFMNPPFGGPGLFIEQSDQRYQRKDG